MRRFQAFVAVSCLAFAACGGPATRGVERPAVRRVAEAAPSGPLVAPELVIGEDVIDRVLSQNSDAVRSPPIAFRAIPVTPIDVSSLAVVKTDGRFKVQLPSAAPVVTPAVHRDLVVVSGGFRSRQMYAFRAGRGDPVWGIELGDDGPSMPACEDGICVFNTESCTIFAVRVETGELVWSWYLGDPLMSAPSIANGLVFAAYPALQGAVEGDDRPMPEGVSHALAAFDLRTGELRWTKWIDADVISAPVAILDAVYAATFAGTVYKLDQQTGRILAARAAQATSAPVSIDGALYFSRRTETLEEFVDAQGNRAERRRVSEQLMRSQKGDKDGGAATESEPMPAMQLDYQFYEGTVQAEQSSQLDAANGFAGGAPSAANAASARMLVGRASVHGLQEFQGAWILGLGPANYAVMGESLVSFDRQSGRQRWAQELPGDLRTLGILAAPPAAAGGVLVVPTTAGDVLVVDPRSGEVRRRFEVGSPLRTQAVVHEGWIYVGTGSGELVGIDTSDAALTGWPTWAANAARTGTAL
jgi:outer membrane protein assembly factor BamB